MTNLNPKQTSLEHCYIFNLLPHLSLGLQSTTESHYAFLSSIECIFTAISDIWKQILLFHQNTKLYTLFLFLLPYSLAYKCTTSICYAHLSCTLIAGFQGKEGTTGSEPCSMAHGFTRNGSRSGDH